MAIEHEHKYLLNGMPEGCLNNSDSRVRKIVCIEQFYITLDRDRKYVSRARCSYVNPTIKFYEECHKKGTGKDTEEIEYAITSSIYEALKEHCSIGMTVYKTRYYYLDMAELLWHVDNYSTGQWIAELENPPDEYMVPFEGAINVTDFFEYKNVSIALNG